MPSLIPFLATYRRISLFGNKSLSQIERFGSKELRPLFFSDAKIWMSEFCILGDTGRDRSFSGPGYEPNDMEFAIHLAKVMHRDLTRLNVSAWHWWLAITSHDYKDGLLKVSPSLESESIETTKAFWIFGNYSRFIRPGFTRIEINNPDEWNGLMASAYKSPDNRKIVLVVVNGAINQKSISIRFAASDLRIDRDSIEVFTTDQNHDHRKSMSSGELVLPPRSTTTVVAKIEQD